MSSGRRNETKKWKLFVCSTLLPHSRKKNEWMNEIEKEGIEKKNSVSLFYLLFSTRSWRKEAWEWDRKNAFHFSAFSEDFVWWYWKFYFLSISTLLNFKNWSSPLSKKKLFNKHQFCKIKLILFILKLKFLIKLLLDILFY